MSETERLYREGVRLWIARELEGARDTLEAALAASEAPGEDGWWFSAARALAQIALELDDPDRAERHLRRLPGHGVGDAQQTALRAKQALLSSNPDAAGIEVSIATLLLRSDQSADPGTLMNGAIALMWCAEVLVELGHGQEAARLAGQARERMGQAGIQDPMLEAGLALVEGGASRLLGDFLRADSALVGVDASLSPDLGVQRTIEKARLAWARGDRGRSQRLYDEARNESERLRYPALVRLIEAERVSGPSQARTDPLPVEEWAQRHTQQVLASMRPCAVVVRVPLAAVPGSLRALEQQVGRLLAGAPHLGYVDGLGTDGEVWELFLEGEDAQALWETVRPAFGDLSYTVEIRRGEEVESPTLD